MLAIAVGALIWLFVWLLSSTSSSPSTAVRPAVRPPPAPAERLFAPSSIWNARIPSGEGIDPSSDRLIRALHADVVSELKEGVGPWISTGGTTTMYLVGPNQPVVRVQLDNPTVWWRVSLQAAFNAVPIPPNAQPAKGPDAQMTIWQPSTDKLWEFFRMRKQADGWHAAWGGAIQNVSQSPGYYTTNSWPGALPVWGATATSLPVVAGTITLAEIQSGHIDHALALNLPYPRAGVWSWPAQRSDGTGTDSNAIPEGAHLRLDPKLDLSRLSLPPITRMIAEAAQRYGMIVRDQTHWGISLFAENPMPTGTDPYYANGRPRGDGLFQGQWPNTLMNSFPWNAVEVVKPG